MNTSKVTRFEIINHTTCEECSGTGRAYDHNYSQEVECWDCHGAGFPGRTISIRRKDFKYELQLQDDDKTLKVFINERHEKED